MRSLPYRRWRRALNLPAARSILAVAALVASAPSAAAMQTTAAPQVDERATAERIDREDQAERAGTVAYRRVETRIANRVQNRLRNRIDRNYDPQANMRNPYALPTDDGSRRPR